MGLDRRPRSLVTIATLAAQGRTLGLELNIRMALTTADRQDVVETLLQIVPSRGSRPAGRGWVAQKVFVEVDRGV